MILKRIKIILVLLFFQDPLLANTQFFEEGLRFFEVKKFEKAKFKFEQDIVFNPKNEMSYLYLSKIFKKLDNFDLAEQNLNTVILLNPQNEEAIYNLARLKLDSSDYEQSKKLNKRLLSLCKKFCEKSKKLKIEIKIQNKK